MQLSKRLMSVCLPAALLFPTVASADRPGFYVGAAWGGYRINESDIKDHAEQ